MGANPMQKMKRNAMLSGLVIGLLFSVVVCVVGYMFITNNGGVVTQNKENSITVCVLNKTIKSGTEITASDIITTIVDKNLAPIDATTDVIKGIAKIDLSAGTVLGTSMLSTTGEILTADLREQEYNMITLPSQLAVGDFIDIRLQLPNGGDYIVISKKKVLQCDASTIWLQMKEDEILTMSNAIIEYYIMAGSKLYATIYSEPGSQDASIPTYCPNAAVVQLINSNKNIPTQITDGEGRFSEALKSIRNDVIEKELNKYTETSLGNIESNLQDEIKKLQQSRESYFGALNAAY